MDSNNGNLVDYLNNYKNGERFKAKYHATFKKLDEDYYPDVEKGATEVDSDVQLNNHGRNHVLKVIERASDLVKISSRVLEIREIYILLICILFHDIGNFFGREKHESNIKILTEFKEMFSNDQVEFITICQIINSHGGTDKENSKDKISKLEIKRKIGESYIRIRFLAAILRFADELADDCDRTSKALLKHDKIGKSKIFHVYSNCLQPPSIEDNAVKLEYCIPRQYISEQINNKYLLDEIYSRIFKMHVERMYCMRFLNPIIVIDNISVTILFVDDYYIMDKITFDIYEKGYPNNEMNIFDICDELLENKLRKDGQYYKVKYE